LRCRSLDGQRHRTRHRALPQPLEDRDLDERCDVDAVDNDVLQFAADLDIDELDAAHPAAVEHRAANLRPCEVLLVEPGHGHRARGVGMCAKSQLAV
jgi:hypothetical protein